MQARSDDKPGLFGGFSWQDYVGGVFLPSQLRQGWFDMDGDRSAWEGDAEWNGGAEHLTVVKAAHHQVVFTGTAGGVTAGSPPAIISGVSPYVFKSWISDLPSGPGDFRFWAALLQFSWGFTVDHAPAPVVLLQGSHDPQGVWRTTPVRFDLCDAPWPFTAFTTQPGLPFNLAHHPRGLVRPKWYPCLNIPLGTTDFFPDDD
jgi:hypothetical protein